MPRYFLRFLHRACSVRSYRPRRTRGKRSLSLSLIYALELRFFLSLRRATDLFVYGIVWRTIDFVETFRRQTEDSSNIEFVHI